MHSRWRCCFTALAASCFLRPSYHRSILLQRTSNNIDPSHGAQLPKQSRLFASKSFQDAQARAQAVLARVQSSAQRDGTWKRLGLLVKLALSTTSERFTDKTSIADVGTDHGLLALALAGTGCFDGVVGTDVSELALSNGAYQLLEKIRKYQGSEADLQIQKQDILDRLSFCNGNGLEPLLNRKQPVNTICIAGMGIPSMITILHQREPQSEHGALLLDALQCQHLVLQPTPSTRPRHWMELFRKLSKTNWWVEEERIVQVDSRWYLTARFKKLPEQPTDDDTIPVPCELFTGRSLSEKEAMKSYKQHHVSWIKQEQERGNGSVLHPDDERWLSVNAALLKVR